MPDYEYLRKNCNANSAVSEAVLDGFILHYAAKQDNLGKEFDRKISKYKHAVQGMPSGWINMIKSQYIIHRVFKAGGLIARYLTHSQVKQLEPIAQEQLRHAASNAWKFSYSEIVANPATDFYEMEDVFTGEAFLLYSPSITKILKEQPVLTWFNLISNNGECWQSFGPVVGFQCLAADDIFFFAVVLNDAIVDDEGLLADLEFNPIPYMMLAKGSAYPLVISKEHEVVAVNSEGTLTVFDEIALDKNFDLDYAEGIYKITDPILRQAPHFATAYYNEDDDSVFLSALTDYGYREFAKALKNYSIELPKEPEVRIHLPMISLIQEILKKEVTFHPYDELFEPTTSPIEDEALEKLNQLMALALPVINSGKTPDILALAKKVGVDPQLAKEFLRISMDQIESMRKR